MTTFVQHSGFLTTRSVRSLLRQPAFAAMTLIQPIIWLLLFGELFKSRTKRTETTEIVVLIRARPDTAEVEPPGKKNP